MTNWTENRLNQKWEFRAVDRKTFTEYGDVPEIIGGELNLSAFDDMRATGTLDFEGDRNPSGIIRVYYSFEVDGETVEEPLATLFATCAKPEYDGKSVSGQLECSSSLKPLSSKLMTKPYSVPAETDAVALAAELAYDCYLPTSVTPSEYRTATETVYEAGTSYLEVANGLLDMAGYSACSPDPYGTIVMKPYVEPADRAVAWVFADGEESIMYPEASPETELDVPNVYALYYETDDEALWATATNTDLYDKASVTNADEVTECEDVSELSGDTQEARLSALKALAASKLKDASATVEKVSISHAWLPIWPADAVTVDYAAAGISWTGTVSSMKVSLAGAMRCETELRRFDRRKFSTFTDGGVIWSGN